MATTLTNARIMDLRDFQVVHPLDDVAEEKRSPAGLGQMHMTPSVKLSLYALQGYLLLIGLTVGYRVLTLAGLFGHHGH
ncbi:MAG: hypothetical protein M3Y13_09565 [Armatimonadota bacterium]|nr:hypothetical protein [Armatimonadota bacterium]